LEVSTGKRSALQGIGLDTDGHPEGPKVGKRIVVFSTKGGNRQDLRGPRTWPPACPDRQARGLVDLDLQFGDAAIALGWCRQRTIFDLVQAYPEFDVPLLEEFMVKHSSGLSVLPRALPGPRPRRSRSTTCRPCST